MVSQSRILLTAVPDVLRLFSVTEHQKCCQTGLTHRAIVFGLYIGMSWIHTQIFQLACYDCGEASLF